MTLIFGVATLLIAFVGLVIKLIELGQQAGEGGGAGTSIPNTI